MKEKKTKNYLLQTPLVLSDDGERYQHIVASKKEAIKLKNEINTQLFNCGFGNIKFKELESRDTIYIGKDDYPKWLEAVEIINTRNSIPLVDRKFDRNKNGDYEHIPELGRDYRTLITTFNTKVHTLGLDKCMVAFEPKGGQRAIITTQEGYQLWRPAIEAYHEKAPEHAKKPKKAPAPLMTTHAVIAKQLTTQTISVEKPQEVIFTMPVEVSTFSQDDNPAFENPEFLLKNNDPFWNLSPTKKSDSLQPAQEIPNSIIDTWHSYLTVNPEELSIEKEIAMANALFELEQQPKKQRRY